MIVGILTDGDTMIMTDEARRGLGLPIDCGVYDAVRNQWTILDSELRRYRPDLFRTYEPTDED